MYLLPRVLCIALLSVLPIIHSSLFPSYPNFIQTYTKNVSEDVEDIRLPWQLQMIRRYIEQTNQPIESTTCVQGVSSMDHQMHWKSLLSAIRQSQQSLIFYSRISSFVLITLWVFRRISQWYQHIAEYELLLDEVDIEYHRYGSPLRDIIDIPVSQMSAISTSITAEYHFHSIATFLSSSLRTACFPLKYLEYSNSLNKDINKVILEIEKINRVSKRKQKLMIHSDGFESFQDMTEKTNLTHLFYQSLLILQSRQVETALRSLLSVLLSSVNTCEDLQQQLRFGLQSTSQPRRLPYSKEQLHHQIRKFSFHTQQRLRSMVFNLNNVYRKIRRRLSFEKDFVDTDERGSMEAKEQSMKEKLLLLDSLNSQIYQWIGRIQCHLHQLVLLRDKILEKAQIDTFHEQGLGLWIEQGVLIGSTSLAQLNLQEKTYFHHHAASSNDYVRHETLSDFLRFNRYPFLPSVFQQLINYTSRRDNHTAPPPAVTIIPHDSNLLNETIYRSRVSVGRSCPLFKSRTVCYVCIEEFTLPIGVHDALAICLLHNDVFQKAFINLGSEVVSVGHWRNVPLHLLDFGHQSKGGLKSDFNLWSKHFSFRRIQRGKILSY